MLFHLHTCFVKLGRLAVFILAALVSLVARAAPPSFFVTLTTSTSPPVNELLLVTADPFGYSVVTVSNDQSLVLTNSPGEAALDFSPDGTLYGAAGDVLSIINPDTAVASNVATLSNAATGAATTGAALAFGRNGTLYVSDGYRLYKADRVNGACTPINPFHTNSATAKLTTPIYGLAVAPNGTLFGGDLDLCTIDPSTAAVTPIGLLCAYPYFAQARDMAFGSDGNLYMIGMDVFGGTALYSVETNHAAATWLGSFPGQAFGLVNSTSPAALLITAQPASQTVPPGGTASFSVTATGEPAPKPAWYFDGAPVPSGTNFTLTITNAAATNAGSYFVVLTNSSGAITSEVVTLTVTNAIEATNFTFLATSASTGVFPDSILSLSTNPLSQSVLGFMNTSLACLGFDTNNVLYGADSTTLYRIDTNSWGLSPIGPIKTLGSTTTLTLSGMAFAPNDVLYGVSGQSLYTISNNSAVATLVVSFPDNFKVAGIAFGPEGILYGAQSDLFRIEPASGGLHLIGPLQGPSVAGDMKVGADGYLYFGSGANLTLYRLDPLTARVSTVAVFNSELTGLAFYPAPFDSKPPAITTPTVDEVAALGGVVTFSATVTGSGPLAYQWRNGPVILQHGSRISGDTTSSLTISNLMLSDAGTYTLAVSNVFGALTDVVATLAVGAGPVITVQPAATTRILEDKNLTLSATAKGAGTLLYQWMVGDTIIPGATSRTLTVTANLANGVATLFYTVFVRNSFGVALSAPAQLSVLHDTTKPAVAITVPTANNARTAGNAIAGTASADAVQVLYWTTNINDGEVTTTGPVAASLAAGSTWSATAALLPGTNILAVQSANQYGNVSAVVSRPFFYEVKAPLALASAGAGSGTFSGKAAVPGDTVPAAGALLNIGEGYSVTVKPGADCWFTNWSGTLGVLFTPTVHFIMESNLNLTANFITNQFFGLAGVYNGLFAQDTGAAAESAGMISSLKLTPAGFYSGSLVLQGVAHPFAGAFDMAGHSSNSISRAGGALTVRMTNLFDTYPNQIRGVVSAKGWNAFALLVANAPGPLPSAAYTMLLPPPTNFSGGYGYAVVTNHAGLVSFSGKLADGAVFNPTAAISQAANVPFYASLYGNTGLVTGWLDFDSGAQGDQVPQGELTWIRKPGAPGSLYSGGFTNLITVQGSSWVAPGPGTAALPFTANAPALLQISGGNLAASFNFLVAVGANDQLAKLSNATPNSLTGSINPKTGLLTVIFGNGKGKATTSGAGVALQAATNAAGAFLGRTNSGSITLHAP